MGEKRSNSRFSYFKILFHSAGICNFAIAYGTFYLILKNISFYYNDLTHLNLEIFYQHLLALSCVVSGFSYNIFLVSTLKQY